jgi:hypothetical protein
VTDRTEPSSDMPFKLPSRIAFQRVGMCDGCAMEPLKAGLRRKPDKRKTQAVPGFFGGSGGGI